MQLFAIVDSVRMDDNSVAVVKNVILKGKGKKPVYEGQFANSEVWGVGADVLSEVILDGS